MMFGSLRALGWAGALAVTVFAPWSVALEKAAVQEKWHTPFGLYLSPHEAFAMKQADSQGVLFVDVRSRPELEFVGYPDLIDANIPIYLYGGFEWKDRKDGIRGSFRKAYNQDFVRSFDKLLLLKKKKKDSLIILMCQSGSRAPIAARALYDAGYQRVYTQVEGFEGIKAKTGPKHGKRLHNGWKQAGLPWAYGLVKEKMYFNFAPQDVAKD